MPTAFDSRTVNEVKEPGPDMPGLRKRPPASRWAKVEVACRRPGVWEIQCDVETDKDGLQKQ